MKDFLAFRGWNLQRNHSGFVTWWRPPDRETGKQQEASQPFRIGEKGQPDWLFYRPRTVKFAGGASMRVWEMLWLEIKKPGGKASKDQRDWIRKHQALGFDCYVVDDLLMLEEIYRRRWPKEMVVR